jgi:hypothetical protein
MWLARPGYKTVPNSPEAPKGSPMRSCWVRWTRPGGRRERERARVDGDEHNARLLAVLLNPPTETSGNRTRLAVAHAARVLRCSEVRTVNLFPNPSRSVVDLNATALQTDDWKQTSAAVARDLREAEVVLGAWGVAGLLGTARFERELRSRWLLRTAAALGHCHIWMVGGEPRHPSRWHQYVADKHRRTTGGPFEARLSEVLRAVRLTPSTHCRHPSRLKQPSE